MLIRGLIKRKTTMWIECCFFFLKATRSHNLIIGINKLETAVWV